MKRDMNLIRDILAKTAEANDYIDARDFADAEHDERKVSYHISILREAGLIDADIVPYRSGGERVTVKGLTWAGQDFCEAVLPGNVWEQTRKTIAATVGSASLAVIKATADGIATALINKALP